MPGFESRRRSQGVATSSLVRHTHAATRDEVQAAHPLQRHRTRSARETERRSDLAEPHTRTARDAQQRPSVLPEAIFWALARRARRTARLRTRPGLTSTSGFRGVQDSGVPRGHDRDDLHHVEARGTRHGVRPPTQSRTAQHREKLKPFRARANSCAVACSRPVRGPARCAQDCAGTSRPPRLRQHPGRASGGGGVRADAATPRSKLVARRPANLWEPEHLLDVAPGPAEA
jgi:hypothetical protein